MSSAPSEVSKPGDEPVSENSPDPPSTAHQAVSHSLPPAFRTHVLSRRTVDFEKSNTLAAVGNDTPPFRRPDLTEVGPVPQPAKLPASRLIRIPEWMGGGFASIEAASQTGCGRSYSPSGFLDSSTENRRYAHYAMVSAIACDYGIPTGLFDAMIIQESRYKAEIFSKKNAYGLTQLMPDTAAGLGVDRYDTEQNLRGGAKYLRQQLDRFGQVHLALAAYNAGPGRVRNGLLPRIAETQTYVANVLLNWSRLAGLPRTAVVQSVAHLAPPQQRLLGVRVPTVSSF